MLFAMQLLITAIGMYVSYRIGFSSGVQAGAKAYEQILKGHIYVMSSLRRDSTNTSSSGETKQAGPSDSSES
jgi:hypothetical protein